jgi:hypothetical protein
MLGFMCKAQELDDGVNSTKSSRFQFIKGRETWSCTSMSSYHSNFLETRLLFQPSSNMLASLTSLSTTMSRSLDR